MSTRARSGQRALDQIRRHRCVRHSVSRAAVSPSADGLNSRAWFEPFTHVEIKPNAVHVVVQRFLECCAKYVMVDAGKIREINIVIGECGVERRRQRHAILFWMFTDWRMHRAGAVSYTHL